MAKKKPATVQIEYVQWKSGPGLAQISNRRVMPGGLIVEEYPPRCSFYIGTRKQLVDAELVGLAEFPPITLNSQGDDAGFRRWTSGDIERSLNAKCSTGRSHNERRRYGDLWELRVFDNRFSFSDHLNMVLDE